MAAPGSRAMYSSSSSEFSSRKRPRIHSSKRRMSAVVISAPLARDQGQERANPVDLRHRVVDVRREPHAASTTIHLHAVFAEFSHRLRVVGEGNRDRSAAFVVVDGCTDREPGRECGIPQATCGRKVVRPDPCRSQRIAQLQADGRHRKGQDRGRASPEAMGIRCVLEVIDVQLEGPRVRKPTDIERLKFREDIAARPEKARAWTAAQPFDAATGRERCAPRAEVERYHARRLGNVHDGEDAALPTQAEDAGYVQLAAVVGADMRDVREGHLVGQMPLPRGQRESIVFGSNARRLVAERCRLLANETCTREIELPVDDAAAARSSRQTANELRQRRTQIRLRREFLGRHTEDTRERTQERSERREPVVPACRPARRPLIEEALGRCAGAARQAAHRVPTKIDPLLRDLEAIARLELEAHLRAPFTVASTTATIDSVLVIEATTKPARASSAHVSWLVRSRPPVRTIIVMSVSLPGWRSLPGSSSRPITSSDARSDIASRQRVRIAQARSSSQSCNTLRITYASHPDGTSCRKSPAASSMRSRTSGSTRASRATAASTT